MTFLDTNVFIYAAGRESDICHTEGCKGLSAEARQRSAVGAPGTVGGWPARLTSPEQAFTRGSF
jgi:hypothetical protein